MAKCAKCSGDNAQKASMIAKAGSSSTKGLGVASGGIGLGYAESKSRLAKEASFKAPSDGLAADSQGCFMVIVAGIAAISSFLAIIFLPEYLSFSEELIEVLMMPIYIASLIVPIIVFVKINNASSKRGAEAEAAERLEKAKWDYKHTWMCLDCGHKWVAPYKMAPKQPEAKEDTKSKDNSFGCIKPIGLFLIISIGLTMYFADRVSWVNVDSLNIRSEPDGEVIGKVTFGEKLTIKETDDGWKRIARGGWVNEKFLSVSDPNKADD
jgi:hypothetical protein